MIIFRETPMLTSITKRDAIHAFFTLLFNHPPCSDAGAAHSLMTQLLEDVCNQANIHNSKFVLSERKNLDMGVSDFEDWKELGYNQVTGADNHRIYHVATTHQYLLIGSKGGIEIHQMAENKYLKFNVKFYRENKAKTLIMSKPGCDERNVWGNLSAPVEFFSENRKRGLVTPE